MTVIVSVRGTVSKGESVRMSVKVSVRVSARVRLCVTD